MERLESSYQQLIKATKTIEVVLKKLNNAPSNIKEDDLRILQDSLIHRFEYCYELPWKYLKLYFEEIFGVELASPRKVFQECLTQKITDREETKKLLSMVDDRNKTTHTYDETISDQITAKIPQHYAIIKTVIERTKP